MTKKFVPLASILALLITLIFASFSLPAQAQSNGWDYVSVAPESGNWNYPGYFILHASRAVTVSWVIKCTYGGCNRGPEQVNNYSFKKGETLSVGWGHQCYAWQFDKTGSVGYIAEAEPDLCPSAATATPTRTRVPPTATSTRTAVPPTATATNTSVPPTATSTSIVIPPTTTQAAPPTSSVTPPDAFTATPTTGLPTPTTPPATATPPAATSTAVVVPPAATQPPPAPPKPKNTPVVLLPISGQAPPSSPMSSPLWPTLVALFLLGLAGMMVWTGMLQAGTISVSGNTFSMPGSQARKALILIVLSLVILITLVLPPLLRQARLDFREPNKESSSYSLQLPATSEQALPISPVEPAGQKSALEIQAARQVPDQRLSEPAQPPVQDEGNPPGVAPAISSQATKPVDTGPVIRLVIPSLKLDSQVQYVPFENQTWNIDDLGMDIAWLGNTSSPGMGSNTVLVGHITVLYLGNGPFRNLYSLNPGDLVYVYTYQDIYTYAVREQAIVPPNDSNVVGPSEQPQLTLLTCSGWDNDSLRYTKRRAVYAGLVSVAPIPNHQSNAWLEGN